MPDEIKDTPVTAASEADLALVKTKVEDLESVVATLAKALIGGTVITPDEADAVRKWAKTL